MAFNATLEVSDRKIARITLSGELDAAAAPGFRAEIEKSAAQQAKRLVLMMRNLEYIASAGLRVLVFAKQKMGADCDIYVVAPQEQVVESLELTGLRHSLVIVREYNAADIENLA